MPNTEYCGECPRCKFKGVSKSKIVKCPRCSLEIELTTELCNDKHCNSCGISARMNYSCRDNW